MNVAANQARTIMSVIAHHIIYSAYGFWLPNDPRGSWSTYVGSNRLYKGFGPATKVTTRDSVAHHPHDSRRCLAANDELKFPPVRFTGRQALEVALAIRDLAAEHGVVIWACAVMPNHVHLLAARHALTPAKIVASCRARASRRLHGAGLWPAERPIWGKGKWAVELDAPYDVRTQIVYINRNPLAADLPPQHWSFVTQYLD
jgi:REP element-mobilizing transposase RayT